MIEAPGIQGFRIIGEAKSGEKLYGYGKFVNGDMDCSTFQWVRAHSPSFINWQKIEGATNWEYVVTPDDVNALIALECIPKDDQGRQGEMVTALANKGFRIMCDANMLKEINGYFSTETANFGKLFILPDKGPATLILSRSSYQIKIDWTEAMLIEEAFAEDLSIEIPVGLTTQFILNCSSGASHYFDALNVRMRDTIVLTMRMFQRKIVIFSPSDQELVYYLTQKVDDGQRNLPLIKETEIYDHEPSELSSLAYYSGDGKMYFFSRFRVKFWVRNLRHGGAVMRDTPGGVWKRNWTQAKRLYGKRGARKLTLAFFKWNESKVEKTNWLMDEYVLTPYQNNEWALYVMYSKLKES